MNSTSCLLVLLALSGCVFAKSTFRHGLDIVRKQNPSDCATSASQECANEVAQIDTSQFDLTTPEGNRDYQEALLAVTCRADCFLASIQQQVCLGGDEDEVTAALQLSCAKNNGELCLLLYNDGVISGDIPQVSSCSIIGEDCTSDCQSELTSISSFFGCCTAIYAEAAFLIPDKETFEKCEVTLDDPCPAVSTDEDSGALDCVTECSIEVNQIDLSQYDFTTTQGNRDYEEAFLAVICRADCFSNYIQYKVCLGLDEDVVTAEVQRECATNNEGQFCTLLYYDGVISGDIPELPFCDTCTSGCQSDLNSISSYLGCCAAPYADADFVKPIIEKCEVALDDPCSNSTDPDSTDQDSGASYATPMFINMIIIAFIATIM